MPAIENASTKRRGNLSTGETSFNPQCVTSALKPIVYVVDSFIVGSARFSDYPSTTQEAFHRCFNARIKQFLLRKATQSRSQPGTPLFSIKWVAKTPELPAFLGSGDIVLGFVHLPPYVYDTRDCALMGPRAVSGAKGVNSRIGEVINQIVLDFWKTIALKWGDLFDAKLPDFKVVNGCTADTGQSLRVHGAIDKIKLKKGRAGKGFYSVRVGLIDIAFPADEAIWVWASAPQRDEKFKVLVDSAFDPQAVAKIGNDLALGNEYLQRVGRGLAYNLLHEFWHCAGGSPRNLDGNMYIENETGVSAARDNLWFQEPVVSEILASYKKIWCDYLASKRLSLDEIGKK